MEIGSATEAASAGSSSSSHTVTGMSSSSHAVAGMSSLSSSHAVAEPSSVDSSPAASSNMMRNIDINGASKYDLLDEEEEEDVCRICRNPGDIDNPLQYPCACSGSIKFVHQECLLQWLNHSNARQCEVCKHPFSFSPVYKEDAPTRLPFLEFIAGIIMKTYHVLQFFLRLSFVLCVWLLIIPLSPFGYGDWPLLEVLVKLKDYF